LFHSFFFPFRDIESLMLRFLSIEDNLDLIQKAGLVFMANPDRNIPARLLEVRQACTGQKQKKIDGILRGVLESLFKAGIVNAEPARMLELLENHYREKRIRQAVERYGIALKSGEPELKLKAAEKLCELARHDISEARELLAQYLARESDADLKAKIFKLFRSPVKEPVLQSSEPEPVAPPEKQQTLAEPEKKIQIVEKSLADLSEPERIQYLDSISIDSYSGLVSQLKKDFTRLPVSEQILAVKTIERFGSSSESDLVLRFLQSDDQELLSASIECLSEINPEALHPFLPQLIKHRFDEVRLAAIKVFAMFDKKQAISLLEKMLFSIKPVQRRNAIFCLASFDFHSISQLFIAALKNESDPENIQQISSILRSNADEEIFYRIFSDRKDCKPGQKEFYDELVAVLAESLTENEGSKTALINKAEEKLSQESRIKSERAAYQLEKIQKIRRDASNNTVFDASLIRFTIVAYSVGAVITALIWFLFLAPGNSPASVKKDPGKSVKTIKTNSITINGKIREVDAAGRKIVIDDQNGKTFEVVIPMDFGQMPTVGQKFHAQLRIVSQTGGHAVAELLTAF